MNFEGALEGRPAPLEGQSFPALASMRWQMLLIIDTC